MMRAFPAVRTKITAPTDFAFERAKDLIVHAPGATLKVENQRRRTLSVENLPQSVSDELSTLGAKVVKEGQYDLD